MRDLLFDIGLACAVIGLIGGSVIGVATVYCTVSLTPIAPGMLTSMVRFMTLGVFGMFTTMLITRHRLSTW